ncbi:MAG: hypothetical protein QXE95_07820 [Candidatus Nitrosocaldus sp.]
MMAVITVRCSECNCSRDECGDAMLHRSRCINCKYEVCCCIQYA